MVTIWYKAKRVFSRGSWLINEIILKWTQIETWRKFFWEFERKIARAGKLSILVTTQRMIIRQRKKKGTSGLLNWHRMKTMIEKQPQDRERGFRKRLRKLRLSGKAFLGSGQPAKGRGVGKRKSSLCLWADDWQALLEC